MLLRNRRFLSALGWTLTQQLMLALSTYWIAQAGAVLASGDIDRVLFHISLFFGFALLAYVSSSMAVFLTAVAANQIWNQYANATLQAATRSLQYASENNRKSISQWLGGEASFTIGNACTLYLEMLSACLNILLTLAVFYVSVGWEIAVAIAASLPISLALVMSLRHRIERTAGQMQRRRLGALLCVEPAWNCAMFGNSRMRAQGLRKLNAKMHSYFREINRYVMLEQVVACCPIILCTLALIGIFHFTELFTAPIAGALVALLPRSLQVFGNVHSLSVYLSQFILVSSKLRNLDGFAGGLEKHRQMHEAPLQFISVLDTFAQKEIQPGDLLKELHRTRNGRYRVTGANGAGKSTLLKIIKDKVADAILITPETRFLNSSCTLSTGQERLKEIENMLSLSPPILLLDEWDANLDDDNCQKIDQRLDEACRRMVIIEVRHLRQSMP